MSGDPASEGKKFLQEGLESVKKGDLDQAVECFYHAAVAFDRAQNAKLISALWTAIGNMLEQDFQEKRSNYLEALQNGRTLEVYEKWYQFPLVYYTDAASEFVWQSCSERVHRQAWAYEWAARYLERSGSYNSHEGAYKLLAKAAERAELATVGRQYPNWPARLWRESISNYIRAHRTIDDETVRQAIRRMESHYLNVKERRNRYRLLANAYRVLKSDLTEMGNLPESEYFRKKERSSLMRYYFSRRNLLRAGAEWLSGAGFFYLILTLAILTFFILPLVYYRWGLIASEVSNDITYADAILYSIESTLGINRIGLYPVGYGKSVTIFQGALAWVGLGSFLWWITRHFE